MKKLIVLIAVLSIGFVSCKKENVLCTAETENLALENATVMVAGTLSFFSKTGTGQAKVYKQQSGKYVLALEKMSLNTGTSLVIYLSQSKTISSPAIKIFSANGLYGDVLHILPQDIDLALFKYIIIQTEPSEVIVASAELN